MFINESVETKNIYLNEATADASYMYEAILEANDAYHDLCMKMVKCEHTCIVNEDSQMLVLAEAEFAENAKKIATQLIEKFKAFCAKVYDWSMSIVAKAIGLTTSAKREWGSKKMINVDEAEFKKWASANPTDVINKLRNGGTLVSLGLNGDVVAEGKQASAANLLETAKKFVAGYRNFMKELRNLRTNFTIDPVAANSPNGGKEGSVVRFCTAAINKMKQCMSISLRVLVACSAPAEGARKVASGAKAAGSAVKGAFSKKDAVDNGTASASILDKF